MPYDPQQDIPVGTPVVGADGAELGEVREAYPHYLLVGRQGQHEDREVLVQSILDFTDGKLRVSVTEDSTNQVDDVETAHRSMEDDE